MKPRYLLSNLNSMMVFGLWPCWSNGVLQTLHFGLMILPQFVNAISITINIILCKGQLNCTLESLCYLIIIYLGLISITSYYLRHDIIKSCIYKLHLLVKRFETGISADDAEKQVKFLVRSFNSYVAVGFVAYNISPFFIYYDCMLKNEKPLATYCGLPTSGTFPFEVYNSPGFEAAFIFLSYAAGVNIYCIQQVSLLPCSIFLHITRQLKELSNKLNSIRGEDNANNYKKLLQCIEYHIALIE